MRKSRRFAAALALALVPLATWAQTALDSAPAEPKGKPPEKVLIGALAGLPRPEGFIVEDLRKDEMKTSSPFRQTYQAKQNFFGAQPVPLARYEAIIGDDALNISPVDLLVENLIQRQGDKLKGKRLKVREFSYRLEQVVNKPQSMVVRPGDAASLGLAVIGTIVGTAILQGRGIDMLLHVKIDVEVDGERVTVTEWPTNANKDAPAKATRWALDKFLYRYELATAPPEPPQEAKKD